MGEGGKPLPTNTLNIPGLLLTVRARTEHPPDPATQALLKIPAGFLVMIFPLSKYLIEHIPLFFKSMKGSITGEVGTIVSFWLEGDSLSRGWYHEGDLGNTAFISSPKAALQSR